MKLCWGFFVVAAIFMGCSSAPNVNNTNGAQALAAPLSGVRNPNSSVGRARVYEKSLSCELLENGSEAYPREHISALSGFAVGPQVSATGQDPKSHLLRPFTSDGCSSSPDGIPLTDRSEAWIDCCIEHDVAYWMGGTHEQKTAADDQLQSCISDKGYPKIGSMYQSFVETFGGPKNTQNYRWGYGWNDRRDYAALNEAEEQQIQTLYGVNSKKVKSVILAQDFKLQKICDTFDPVFWGFRKEEVEVYQFLNKKLKKPDVIEWARWSYYNIEVRTISIKLKNCNEPVTVTLSKNAKEPVLHSTCLPF